MLKIGLTYEKETLITKEMSAISMHSGDLRLLATPYMITLMEEAALKCVADQLEAGTGTVGTMVRVHHDAPTPIGMRVCARATLTAIDGRKLTFDVEAFDQKERIGHGVHERMIIDRERFQKKCDGKSNG